MCIWQIRHVTGDEFRVSSSFDKYRIRIKYNSTDFIHPTVKSYFTNNFNGNAFSTKDKDFDRAPGLVIHTLYQKLSYEVLQRKLSTNYRISWSFFLRTLSCMASQSKAKLYALREKNYNCSYVIQNSMKTSLLTTASHEEYPGLSSTRTVSKEKAPNLPHSCKCPESMEALTKLQLFHFQRQMVLKFWIDKVKKLWKYLPQQRGKNSLHLLQIFKISHWNTYNGTNDFNISGYL